MCDLVLILLPHVPSDIKWVMINRREPVKLQDFLNKSSLFLFSNFLSVHDFVCMILFRNYEAFAPSFSRFKIKILMFWKIFSVWSFLFHFVFFSIFQLLMFLFIKLNFVYVHIIILNIIFRYFTFDPIVVLCLVFFSLFFLIMLQSLFWIINGFRDPKIGFCQPYI